MEKKPTVEQIKEWWDNLTGDEQTEHEKSYGIYGHDQGTNIDDGLITNGLKPQN